MVVAAGLAASLLSTFFYGTFYVPARKYEIHDGLAFQWYQCSGIMLTGLCSSLFRNNWAAEGEVSNGFYVCPYGLLSGLLFQLANVLATTSVRMCGLGMYYTVHQVSNLGVTFFVGIFGPQIGLPAEPPHRIGLAAIGFLLVLVGMAPVMFMEKEGVDAEEQAAPGAVAISVSRVDSERSAPDAGATGQPALPMSAMSSNGTGGGADGAAERGAKRLEALFSKDPEATRTTSPTLSTPGGAAGAFGAAAAGGARHLSPARSARAGAYEETTASRRPGSGAFGGAGAGGGSGASGAGAADAGEDGFIRFNSRTWDGVIGRLELGSLDEFRRRHMPPMAAHNGMAGLVIDESPAASEAQDEDWAAASAGGRAAAEPLLPGAGRQAPSWWRGIVLSLIAGALYASVYLPLLPWKAKLKAEGVVVQGFDSFFSLCVGLYLASTAWLVCGGALKKYRGQKMDKAVLRPALLSGVIYGGASFTFLYSLMLLPYAIGYALCVGGALAVSQLWGTLFFGEASTTHNRRCVVCSFGFVLFGIVLLGLAA